MSSWIAEDSEVFKKPSVPIVRRNLTALKIKKPKAKVKKFKRKDEPEFIIPNTLNKDEKKLVEAIADTSAMPTNAKTTISVSFPSSPSKSKQAIEISHLNQQNFKIATTNVDTNTFGDAGPSSGSSTTISFPQAQRKPNKDIITDEKEKSTKTTINKPTTLDEDIEKGMDLKVFSNLLPLMRDTLSLKAYKSFWRGNKRKVKAKLDTIPQRPPPIKVLKSPDETTPFYVEQFFNTNEKKKKTKTGFDEGEAEAESENESRNAESSQSSTSAPKMDHSKNLSSSSTTVQSLTNYHPLLVKDDDTYESKLEVLRKMDPLDRRIQKRKWKRRMREETLFLGGNKGLFERHLAELRDYQHQDTSRKLRYQVYGQQKTEKQRISEIIEALDKARLSNQKIHCPKPETEEEIEDNELTTVVVNRNEPNLIHVEFPGAIKDMNAALECFGGESKLYKSLGEAKRKLEIKLRPWDPSCKSSYGDGMTTCGILVKIRRKKVSTVPTGPPKEPEEEPELVDLDDEASDSSDNEFISNKGTLTGEGNEIEEDKEYSQGGESYIGNLSQQKVEGHLQKERHWKPFVQRPYVSSSGTLISKEWILSQDAILSEKRDARRKISRIQRNKDHEDKHCMLNIPDFKTFKPCNSQIEVNVLGLVSRQYKFFTSLNDLQFQPFKMFDCNQICTAGKITDVFINPDGPYPYFSELMHLGKRIPEFIPPNTFSRVYKYFNEFTMFGNQKSGVDDDASDVDDTESNADEDSEDEKITSVIGQKSGRPKRLVHTHLFDFKKTDSDLREDAVQVPNKAYDRANVDIKRKGLNTQADVVSKLFKERPIWTKFALEHNTSFDPNILKFILPGIAYFTINSPWRSAWIRLGYDPRKDKNSYVYQMMDYRVPFIYRKYLGLNCNEGLIHNFAYKAGTVPPKGQIFYQLCDIQIPEVEDLVVSLRGKIMNDDVHYDPKWGWVPSETLEYVRYNITRHIELHLYSLDKLPQVYSSELDLRPGEIFPRDKIRFCHNSQNKRIRRKKATASSNRAAGGSSIKSPRVKKVVEEVLDGLPQPIYKHLDDAGPSGSSSRITRSKTAAKDYNPLEEDTHLFGNTYNSWSSRNTTQMQKIKEEVDHLMNTFE